MAYYNRNYKRLNLKSRDMKYLTSGECAKILYNNDIIFKEYFSDTILNCRLNPKMFDILKKIDNPHFIKLFDIYSDFDLLELIENKMKLIPFITDAYTAKYYSDDSINALLEPKDYILDNFRELEILFDIFTGNMIIADDVKRKNVLLSHNGIIIIDPDTFYTMEASKTFIATENKKKLLNLLRSIFIDAVKNQPHYGKKITWIDTELVDINITENTDVTYEISKKLKYVKNPIEILPK